jgi:hypothetical protein
MFLRSNHDLNKVLRLHYEHPGGYGWVPPIAGHRQVGTPFENGVADVTGCSQIGLCHSMVWVQIRRKMLGSAIEFPLLFKVYSTIDSSKMLGAFPEALNFNRLFLNQVICTKWSVLLFITLL